MGNFWDAMDKLGQALEDMDDVVGDVKQTTSTAKYGYGKIRNSTENFVNIPCNLEANLEQVTVYANRKRKCKRRTIFFCLLMIGITVWVCIFL